MFALIFKELRSISRVIAFALFVDGWLLCELTGQSSFLAHSFPRVEGFALVQPGWVVWFGFVLAAIGGVLGLAMSLDDGLRATWQFALFRPVSRRAYIGVKLAVGAALTLALSFLPIGLYAAWAATPGNVAGPFRWSLMQPMLEACGWNGVIFLGAFLSGIRPATWWWSRLWPLATTVVLGFWFWLLPLIPNFPNSLTPSSAQYWGLCVGMAVVLIVSIMDVVEERDFA